MGGAMFRFSLYRQIIFNACILALLGTTIRHAHAQSFDDYATRGQEAMTAGNLEEAIRCYEHIVEKGKTYVNVLEVKFDLAWAYYMVGQYEQAIALFADLSGVKAPSEAVKEQSIFLMAECYIRWAGTFEETDANRKKHLNKGIELHTKFQADYPKNPNLAESFYGRAYGYHLAHSYDDAANDLLRVINTYKSSPSIREAQYLLASVYASQGRDAFKANKKDEGLKHLAQSREIFDNLAKGEQNLALANDSAFAMAETWYNVGMFQESIPFYRSVKSKREVLDNLNRIRANLRGRVAQALASKQDSTDLKKGLAKLDEQISRVRKTGDLMVSAYFRIAECFFNMKRYDEARMIWRHLLPFTEGEQKVTGHFMIVNSFVEENDGDNAARELADFQLVFGMDNPIAEYAELAIGQIFMKADEPEKALQALQGSVRNYPNGKGIQDALYLKFSAEYSLQKYEDCTATCAAYMDAYTNGAYLANALYLRAMANLQNQQWEQALKYVTELLQRFPKPTENFPNLDEPAYQRGWILNQAKMFDQAVKQFDSFIETYPESALLPHGMYQKAVALTGAGKGDEARALLRQIARKFPNHEIAPAALFQVAITFYEKENFADMFSALEDFVHAFPNHPYAVDAYFWMGFIAKQDKNLEEAAAYFGLSYEADPAHERAPECLVQMALSWREWVESKGNIAVLPLEARTYCAWALLDAAALFEDIILRYPDSLQAYQSAPGIADAIFQFVRYRQWTEEQANNWFAKAEARYKNNPQLQAQLAFSYGSFLNKNMQKDKALAAFRRSIQIAPDAHLSPTILKDYAEALIEAGDFAAARDIYNKIIQDNQGDDRVLAPAYYGLANVAYAENKDEETQKLIEEVLDLYPWFEEAKKGNVMLAEIEERNAEKIKATDPKAAIAAYEKAEKKHGDVWKTEKANDIRVAAQLGVARCQLAQAEILGRSNAKFAENIKVADENLAKIIVLYEAYPDYVSEAMFFKAKAHTLAGDKQKAVNLYDRILKEHPKSKWAKPASERIQQFLKEGFAPMDEKPAASAPTPAEPARNTKRGKK